MISHLNYLIILFRNLTLLFFFIIISPLTQATNDWHGVVVTQSDELNIRSGPTINEPVIGRAVKGERLLIKGLSGEWYLVKLYDGTSGFVHGSHINLLGDSSSHLKYFGMGNWFYERDCPDIDLFWKEEDPDKNNLSSPSPCAYFRGKDGREIRLGKGIANFSPNCIYFWFTEHSSLHVKLFSTSEGLLIDNIEGFYPVWSKNSTFIYFITTNKQYKLWRHSLNDKHKELIYSVDDFHEDVIVGGKMDWISVEFDDDDNVIWSYPAKNADGKSDKELSPSQIKTSFQIKKMTINPISKKKLKEEWINGD